MDIERQKRTSGGHTLAMSQGAEMVEFMAKAAALTDHPLSKEGTCGAGCVKGGSDTKLFVEPVISRNRSVVETVRG